MDKSHLISYLEHWVWSSNIDAINLQEWIRRYIEKENIQGVDRSHLEWELTHIKNAHVELMHDLERLISTIKGKGFHADTEIQDTVRGDDIPF